MSVRRLSWLRAALLLGAGATCLSAPRARASTIYVVDLRAAYVDCFGGCAGGIGSRTNQQLLDDFDLDAFAVSVQGLVNRSGPKLYVYATAADVFWLQRALDAGQPWGWAAGSQVVTLNQPSDGDAQIVAELIARFGSQLSGSVRWTADVPAGFNVATSAAGVQGLAIVRQGSSFEQQIAASLPVQLDLVGRFQDKIGAATWARQTFLQKGLTKPGLLGYALDGWPWALLAAGQPLPGEPWIFQRDYLIGEKAFLFDLSPWSGTEPVDDPTEPLGADTQELQTILSDAQGAAPPTGITSVWGFVPVVKYASTTDPSQGPVASEWRSAQLLSSYDARLTGGGGDSYGLQLANASFHRWGTFPAHAPRNPTPTPGQLTDLGYLNQHLVNPGFEWGAPGPWQLKTDNRAIYDDPAQAASGRDYLEVNVQTTGESFYQDTTFAPSAGESWRLRVAYRIKGSGTARLVLWALGPQGNLAFQANLGPTTSGWQEAQVVAGPLPSQSYTALRAQVYVDTAGVNYDFDEFRLARTAPVDLSVAPLTYVGFYLGDYDSGLPIYTVPTSVYPKIWNDATRGATPVGWGFDPDALDYLPGVMAYFYATRGATDYFTCGDSGAGYVNPSSLTPAGAGRYIGFTRRAMGRFGESFLSFFLNGNDGIPDAATMQLWNSVGPDGVMVNWRQLGDPTRRLVGEVPWCELEQNWSYGGISVAEAADNVGAAYEERYPGADAGSFPRFLYGRSVYTGTDMAAEMMDAGIQTNPERDYRLVDPYTFGYLLRASLGGQNVGRASWLDDSIPRTLAAGQSVGATVTVRNDGWEDWPAGACTLGLVLGRDPMATPDAPNGEQVLRFPLPGAVAPGGTVAIPVSFTAPATVGGAELSYDLDCGDGWFEGSSSVSDGAAQVTVASGNLSYRDGVAIVASLPDGGIVADGGLADGGAPTGEDAGATDGGEGAPTDGGLAPASDGGTGGPVAGSPDAGSPAILRAASGCGCGTSAGPSAAPLWILALALGLARRRRRVCR